MSSRDTDRRAPDAPRVPFDGMVEVGGAQGPSFEAQAMNVSVAGMALRAGYLPAVGQPLTCQFETEEGASVLASGEVTWCKDGAEGGEFGLSFGKLDAASASALKALFEVSEEPGAAAPKIPVGRVRLHIEGLGVPMKARVKDASIAKVTTFSELGYLQKGKELELEDAETGEKRPARIHSVQVETNEAAIPQLVVTMKYEDESARAAADATSEEPPEAREDGEEPKHDFGERAKGIGAEMGKNIMKIGPALGGLFARAKTAAAMLAQKRKESAAKAGEGDEAPVRRTTAPAPGGRLQAQGRKVVRSEAPDEAPEAPPAKKLDKRKLAIGGAAGIALILGLMAMRKPHEPAPLASAPPAESAAAVAPPAPAAPQASAVAPGAMAATPGAMPGAMPGAIGPGAAAPQAVAAMPPGSMGADDGSEPDAPAGKKGKPKPFSNGPVGHGTVLKLKMDGPIERLQGAPQPTGFTVVLPNRRSLEAASPLAAKDSRISGIRVANDGNGAELTVSFKDGVPNYLVRAKGDTLEMVLAKEKATAETKKKGQHKADGKADHPKGKTPAKGHGKH